MLGSWWPLATAGMACLGAVLLSAGPLAKQQTRAAGGPDVASGGLFADLPSRGDLDADAQWVDRRYDVGSRRQPERLRRLGAEQASRYIRSGRPFIVTDMVEGWGMRDWDCESVRRDFGDEEMHLWNAYGDNTQPAVVRLSDPWQQWLFPQEESRGAGVGESQARDKADANETAAPSALSFHWYPLNGGAGAWPGDPVFGSSPESIRKLQAAYDLPSFLPQKSRLNQRFCKDRMEVFFGMPRAGAKLHADAVCEPIFSVQLSGRKRWRLSPLPPYRRAMPAATNDYISQRPEGEWEPTYDFVLEPGEAVFFPTSWLHETRNVPLTTKDGDVESAAAGRQAGRAAGGAEGDGDLAGAAAAGAAAGTDVKGSGESHGDGCSLSLSLQWRYPFPVGFIRDFAPRLLRAQETHFCFEHWAPFITGDVDGVRRLAFPVLEAASTGSQRKLHDAERAMRRRIRDQFVRMDADGDGFVTKKEKAADLKEIRLVEQDAGALVEFEPGFEAADWVFFHDEPKPATEASRPPDEESVWFAGGDGDGRVSLQEWEDGITRLVREYVVARQQGAVDVEEEEEFLENGN